MYHARALSLSLARSLSLFLSLLHSNSFSRACELSLSRSLYFALSLRGAFRRALRQGILEQF